MDSSIKWKILSIGLIAAIATGLLTPPANAATLTPTQEILNIVKTIEAQLTNANDGLHAIQSNVTAIKAKTDKLPSDPASNSQIISARNAINAHTDSAVASISSHEITQAQYQILKCNATPRSDIDLSYCDLQSLYLPNATLNNANLTGSKLTSAFLEHGNLAGTAFKNADVTGTDFDNANLQSANFAAANFTEGALCSSTQFNGAHLVLANFAGDTLKCANFSNSMLEFANMTNTNLQNTNFNGADISGVYFRGCHGTPVGTPSVGTLPTCSP